ncbi:probable flavin-containing monooxygenase 1 [Rutidosis leptorrhynchoides]|uniref:probable flavin-containing monooxygenase 1 n=1 Tax=Rutidosis leptorrhynchoides TaxID=125765 RepID=UPI003A9906EF
MDNKQVAIIGAGISGLLACKYCLSKGFNPIVFDFESDIGGVWAKTIKTTRLQAPKALYQFSDFPWPDSVTDHFPTQQQMLDYFRSYATHFNLMPHIKLNSRVLGISYDGPDSDKWLLWNGTGETFPTQGKWNVNVEDTRTATTKVCAYTLDFVILCLGRFKDVPNIPNFAAEKGPDVFQGQAIHSMKYASMDHEKASEFVKGKKVVVVGFGKTGLDIARECSAINGSELPTTILYRRDHWKLPDWAPWGYPMTYYYFNRFSQLLVHKPGEGFLLSLLATLLSPLRWGVSKLIESYVKKTLPLAKFDMLPQHSISKDMRSCLISYIPDSDDFFQKLEKGSIKLQKSQRYNFYEKGISTVEDKMNIEADIVIFATGFRGQEKLKNIFESSTFGQFIAGSPRVPLYRECIHPRIPQLAVIGFSESLSNIYISEMRAKWVAALLEGAFKVPSVNEMEKDIAKWDDYMKQSSEEYNYRSSIGTLEIWYNDQLCKDMGMNIMRKNGPWANLFEPYGPVDYVES